MALRKQQWLKILSLSEQMYEFAKQDEWPMVQEMQAERQKRIMDFFNSGVALNEVEEMAENIKNLLKSDKILMESGLQAKNKVGEALYLLGRNQKAAGAYIAHTDHKMR